MSTMKHYPDAPASPRFPELEGEILQRWKAENTFRQSVEQRPAQADGSSNAFVFYDGPPFANGLPHYGHLLTGFVKDAVARYQTLRGHRVERRFGWDCHGLPAEMGAEKELGISGQRAIQEYGIDNFNAHCRTSVMRFTQEWERYVTRQARWVDFVDDYKTMDFGFMESVLWVFKQLHDKGLVYEAHRVMPYSWAAETPLSNFETHLDNSYRERVDPAVTVAFELKDRPAGAPEADRYYILAWTTTPWTLPSNLALAVSGKLEYVAVVRDQTCYILAASALPAYAKELGLAEDLPTYPIAGTALLGAAYIPLFPYFAEHPNAFRVLDGSDFVEDGAGTGVVHMAPGFGEDDQRVCEAAGIALVCPVDHTGRYTDEVRDIDWPVASPLRDINPLPVGEGRVKETINADRNTLTPPLSRREREFSLRGINVIAERTKDESEPYTPQQLEKYGLANLRILDYLKASGQLIKREDYAHNYPHCWRTDTPLIYKAVPSWYVKVTAFKDRMVELNQQINWIPGHVKDGLFGKWLENARDWSISRNRFWGSPIPVWRSDNPANTKLYVFGSAKELEDFFGEKVTDLHRPFIDQLVAPDPENPRYTLRRVPEVFDCWFESGSMPYAQVHYPFENADWFHAHYPADFIVEYAAQTRGWFYTLMVLGTALFDKPPFLNCICHGVILDDKGRKLSKSLGNYTDPLVLIEEHGADALRWYMLSSPVMRGMELYIDKEGSFIRDAVRLYIKPLWNAYHFFCLYANVDGVQARFIHATHDLTHFPLLDRYLLGKIRVMAQDVREAMDAYALPNACQSISDFLELLNNWYIRRSRERFWSSEQSPEKQAAYDTLFTALHTVARVASPLLPLTCEAIFSGLEGHGNSVHLSDWPEVAHLPQDATLIRDMDRVRDACNVALSLRTANNIRTRQPLASITLVGLSDHTLPAELVNLLLDELNIKECHSATPDKMLDYASYKLQLHFPVAGKRLGAKMKEVGNAAKQGAWERNAKGEIALAGVTLLPEEYTLTLEAKPEYAHQVKALTSNDAVILMDTNLTEELRQEGIARDLVRLVQQARKDAGLHVADRILLGVKTSADARQAVESFATYITEQTLALTLEYGVLEGALYTTDAQLDETPVHITVAKAA
jgi:isoleucyl-tRNA synthetase